MGIIDDKKLVLENYISTSESELKTIQNNIRTLQTQEANIREKLKKAKDNLDFINEELIEK